MRIHVCIAAALATFLANMCAFGQVANMAGVWKADLAASKIAGPPLKDFVEIIDRKGTRITETIGQIGMRGEQRSELSFTTDGAPTIQPYMGVPSRETAVAESNGFTLTIETAGRPETAKRHYEWSTDGGTVTIASDASMNGHEMHSVVVLKRADDAAAAWLRKPEALASEQMKNVKTPLKDLPASQFMGNMRYFAWALNKDCEFCHVKGHFDSDDKEEKRTARKMIAMVGTVNEKFFDGKTEVVCFTCHEFHSHPLARPRFEGEPEHHHEGEGPEPGHDETHKP